MAQPNQAPPPSKFDEELKRIQTHASMGIFMPDVRKIKEGGMDIPTKIKLAINRQYFTLSQAIHAFILGAASVSVVTCFVLWQSKVIDFFASNNPSLSAGGSSNASSLYFGVLLSSFWIANRVAHSSYIRELWCDPDRTTEDDYKMSPCVDTRNCWATDDPGNTVLCRPKPADVNIPGLFYYPYWMLRYLLYFGAIGGSIYFFVAFTNQEHKGFDLAQIFFAVLIGFSTGWILGFMLS